jgi:hypothetical protein
LAFILFYFLENVFLFALSLDEKPDASAFYALVEHGRKYLQ